MAPTLHVEDERTQPQHVEALQLAGRLREATGEKGARRVLLDLIVEGFGNKADNHYYSGDLLTRVAERFAGAKMYSDHLTREAEQKLGGLPRSWRDMVGRVTRAWVDVTEGGRRVIRGEAEIFDDQLWKILEQAIDAVGVSINARGISRPGTADGRSARLVEDISQIKSVDVVSEAGAGGRILALIEAELEDTEDMATDVAEATNRKRRQLSDATAANDAEDAVDAGVDDSLEDDDDAEQAQPQRRRRTRTREADADADADAEAADDADAREADDDDIDDIDDIDDFDDDDDGADASQDSDADADGGSDADADASADADAGGDDAAAAEASTQEARRGGDPLLRFAADMGAEAAWGPEWRPEYDDPGLGGEDVHPRGRRVVSPNGDFELVHEGGADAQQLTRMIESRARALAATRLRAAVQEALRVAREEYDERLEKRLAEAERGFQRKLAQRDQHTVAGELIEGASLPRLTTQRLKEEFFDAFYESDEGEPDEDALREAVTTAISDRKRELGEFTGRRGARTEGVGLTEASVDASDKRGGGDRREPNTADIDEGIERELG